MNPSSRRSVTVSLIVSLLLSFVVPITPAIHLYNYFQVFIVVQSISAAMKIEKHSANFITIAMIIVASQCLGVNLGYFVMNTVGGIGFLFIAT
jgi:hypothetical protein